MVTFWMGSDSSELISDRQIDSGRPNLATRRSQVSCEGEKTDEPRVQTDLTVSSEGYRGTTLPPRPR